MGIEISKSSYSEQEYQAFIGKLQENLEALKLLLARPGFGNGAASLGAELEMYVIDAAGKPMYLNKEILDAAADPQLTLELNRYNLEYNLTPYALSQQAFFATEQEVLDKLQKLRRVAADMQARIVPIGILPTLSHEDFGQHSMTDRKRYQVLVDHLVRRRGEQFQIDINGRHPLKLNMDDVTLEGANTSFQVHYRVAPEAFADTFNAFQLVTPLVLALAANSPGLFGHDLWHETRIPLFKQSIDTRIKDRYQWHQSARVSFGHGWVRRSAFELFAESVQLYPPFLPICGEQHPLAALQAGEIPKLEELRLHQSSVWWWNRPVYDDAEGGMLRIEMRSLPAGPTAADMAANAALFIGLAEGIRPEINDLLPALPFDLAEYNFYRSAQHGLAAQLVWPNKHQSGCDEQPIIAILEQYLPVAAQGLVRIGIGEVEINHYLGIIEKRLHRQQTGAIWQQRKMNELERYQAREAALHQMLEIYLANSVSNVPVAEWE